jgi:hypothetical protein
MKISLASLLLCFQLLAGTNAGAGVDFLRSGWVGAENIALGTAVEAIVSDVYALYWNPAGLIELKGKNALSKTDIQNRARKGNITSIKENDLLDFSEDKKKTVFQMAMSGSMLDAERQAAFIGTAFSAGPGIMAIGVYSLFSLNIQGYDTTGNPTSMYHYVSGAPYFSYALAIETVSFGVTLKGIYQTVGDVTYLGAAFDVGVQLSFFTFVKIGFVVQDIGAGLAPVVGSAEAKYNFSYPVLRASVALVNSDNDSISVSIVKKLEQDGIDVNVGIKYNLHKTTALCIGLNNEYFTAGISFTFGFFGISYAFMIDRINYGYNNTVSFQMIF